MHRFKKIGIIASLVATMTFSMVACSSNNLEEGNETIDTAEASNEASQETSTAKYIFMFIGDGMSYPQVNGAQIYNGTVDNKDSVELTRLGFTEFPVTGSASTQDSTSFAPDSASTATSIASGVKTHSGVIGLEADKTTEVTTIAEQLKEKGYKVGIVSTVTLNHATPAAFYANVESRNNYYDIALQMADSDFDYFAGGELGQPTGKDKDQRDIYEILEEKGYTVTRDKDEILSLDNESGKVYAINPELVGGAMEYSIDMDEDSLKLSDLVSISYLFWISKFKFNFNISSWYLFIYLSCSGAILDLAIDISAAVEEVVDKKPDISRKEILLSGLNVGRSVVGSQTTTLLLAYMGSFIGVMMVYMAQGTPLMSILNTKFISSEIVQTFVGCIGLVIVSPLTSLICSIIYTKKHKL